MRYYESKEAKCPFYRKEDQYKVFCEGVNNISSINLNFPNRKECRAYKKEHCNSNYHKCSICKMLYDKYKD
jgi:hypothetical protein